MRRLTQSMGYYMCYLREPCFFLADSQSRVVNHWVSIRGSLRIKVACDYASVAISGKAGSTQVRNSIKRRVMGYAIASWSKMRRGLGGLYSPSSDCLSLALLAHYSLIVVNLGRTYWAKRKSEPDDWQDSSYTPQPRVAAMATMWEQSLQDDQGLA